MKKNIICEVFSQIFVRSKWGNIGKLFAWRLLKDPAFIGPILIIFIRDKANMSFFELTVCEAVCMILITILEIPSGAIADMLGRKNCIVISSILSCGFMTILSAATAPIHIWIGNILWGISMSLSSGADEALLFESVRDSMPDKGKTEQENKFHQIITLQTSLGLASHIIMSGTVALLLLFVTNTRLFFVMATAVTYLSVPFALMLVESRHKQKLTLNHHWAHMTKSLLFCRNHFHIKWIIAYAMCSVVVNKMHFFYQPWFEDLGISLKYFGAIYLVFNLTAFFSTLTGRWILNRWGECTSFHMLMIANSLSFMIMGVISVWWAIFFALLHQYGRGAGQPIISTYINRHILDEHRATVISIKCAAGGIIEALTLPLLGYLVGKSSNAIVFVVVGIFLIFSCAMLSATYKGGKKGD